MKCALVFTIILINVMNFYGIFRLNDTEEPDTYVRVAYTTGPYVGDFINYVEVDLDTCLKNMNQSVVDARNQQAEILIFNEESFGIRDTDEEILLNHAKALAAEYNIHILYGLDIKDTDGSTDGKNTNKIVWVDRQGELLGEYTKYQIIPFIESGYVRGDGAIPNYTITVGNKKDNKPEEAMEINIAFAICYDSNFPSYIKKGLSDETDILFLPSWDWSSITKLHYHICGNLAVENHVTFIKPTYDGITIAVDPYGREIIKTSTNETGFEKVQIVDLPVCR